MKSKTSIAILVTFVLLLMLSLVARFVLHRDVLVENSPELIGVKSRVPASQDVIQAHKDAMPKSAFLISDFEFMKQISDSGLNEELLVLALKWSPQLKEISHEPGWAVTWPKVAAERERTLDAIKKFSQAGFWEVAVAMVNMELPTSEDSPDGWATVLPVVELLKETLTNEVSPRLESLIVKQVIEDTLAVRSATDLNLVTEERRRVNTLMKLLERTLATPDEYNRMDRSKWIPLLAARNGGGYELELILSDAAPTIRP